MFTDPSNVLSYLLETLIQHFLKSMIIPYVREQVTEVLNCIHQMELVHIQRMSGPED